MRYMHSIGLGVECVLKVTGLPGVGVVTEHGHIVVLALFSLSLSAENDPVSALVINSADYTGSIGSTVYGIRLEL